MTIGLDEARNPDERKVGMLLHLEICLRHQNEASICA